jgi:hypothetical protein
MIAFGVAQLFLSQIPDFHDMWWLSVVAAVMSFFYSTIALALGISKVAGDILQFVQYKFSLYFWQLF